jgi:transposase
METIRALTKCLKEIDRAIVKEFDAFNTTLKSIRGLGPVYSASIFAEIGDIGRFKKERQIAKFA